MNSKLLEEKRDAFERQYGAAECWDQFCCRVTSIFRWRLYSLLRISARRGTAACLRGWVKCRSAASRSTG